MKRKLRLRVIKSLPPQHSVVSGRARIQIQSIKTQSLNSPFLLKPGDLKRGSLHCSGPWDLGRVLSGLPHIHSHTARHQAWPWESGSSQLCCLLWLARRVPFPPTPNICPSPSLMDQDLCSRQAGDGGAHQAPELPHPCLDLSPGPGPARQGE